NAGSSRPTSSEPRATTGGSATCSRSRADSSACSGSSPRPGGSTTTASPSTPGGTTRPHGSSPAGARPYGSYRDAAPGRVPTPHDEPVDPEQDHRADDRGDDAWTLSWILVPARSAAEKPGQERARDAEQHRDDDAARVLARHEELRQRPGDE